METEIINLQKQVSILINNVKVLSEAIISLDKNMQDIHGHYLANEGNIEILNTNQKETNKFLLDLRNYLEKLFGNMESIESI